MAPTTGPANVPTPPMKVISSALADMPPATVSNVTIS